MRFASRQGVRDAMIMAFRLLWKAAIRAAVLPLAEDVQPTQKALLL